MIQHMALFTLKTELGSQETASFLEGLNFLASLEGVRNFRVWKQTSPFCDFDYGISMEFEDQAAFKKYMVDPDHGRFAYDIWFPNVKRQNEINLEIQGAG